MIIVEGPDGTGKTTLLTQLSNELNLPVLRSRKPHTQTDIQMLNNWANACPFPILLDRHSSISDLVYGTIIREHTHSSIDLAFAHRNNNFLIYCRTAKPNIEAEQQMDGVVDHYPRIAAMYEQMMDHLEPDFIYDWTNPKAYPELITHLQHYLHRSSNA